MLEGLAVIALEVLDNHGVDQLGDDLELAHRLNVTLQRLNLRALVLMLGSDLRCDTIEEAE